MLSVVLMLGGCSTGTGSAAATGSAGPSGTPTVEAAPPGDAGDGPFLDGLDVCRLATAAMVDDVSGQEGIPVSRVLTGTTGYDGVLDECGFGPAFRSQTFGVAVGLAPVTPRVLRGMPGRPVAGLGAGARLRETDAVVTVVLVTGSVLLRLTATPTPGDASPRAALLRAARQLVATLPSRPPADALRTTGRCAGLDAGRVDAVLGEPARVSRSLDYRDGSATCSWATGHGRADTVTVAVYTNQQVGPFLADLRDYGPSRPVPGVAGDAFTTSDAAYVVAGDGQAVAVSGRFGPRRGGSGPLPVTPELTALLRDAAGSLG